MRFTVVSHDLRKELEINITEYIIADSIYHLSVHPENTYGGWCYASKQYFADNLGISRRTVVYALDKLIKKGLVIRDERTNYLRTTEKWYSRIMADSKLIAQGEQKLRSDCAEIAHDDCAKIAHNNNILDNNINNIYSSLPKFMSHKDEVVQELQSKFKDKDIGKAFDTLVDYCQAKNKKYKNYKSALSNWLRNDDRNQFSKLPNKTNNYQSIQL